MPYDNDDRLYCPACSEKTGLKPTQWKDVSLDVCPACHGIWFDVSEMLLVAQRDELSAIDQAFEGSFTPPAIDEAMQGAERRCPLDESKLIRHVWGEKTAVVMDWCDICGGTWLDPGELEGYVQALQEFSDEIPEVAEELRKNGVTPSKEQQAALLAQADEQSSWVKPLLRALGMLGTQKA